MLKAELLITKIFEVVYNFKIVDPLECKIVFKIQDLISYLIKCRFF